MNGPFSSEISKVYSHLPDSKDLKFLDALDKQEFPSLLHKSDDWLDVAAFTLYDTKDLKRHVERRKFDHEEEFTGTVYNDLAGYHLVPTS